jgi:hypothetical protein
MGVKLWALTSGAEHRLRVLEMRVLWKISGPKTEQVTGGKQNCIIRSVTIYTACQILLGTGEKWIQIWYDKFKAIQKT